MQIESTTSNSSNLPNDSYEKIKATAGKMFDGKEAFSEDTLNDLIQNATSQTLRMLIQDVSNIAKEKTTQNSQRFKTQLPQQNKSIFFTSTLLSAGIMGAGVGSALIAAKATSTLAVALAVSGVALSIILLAGIIYSMGSNYQKAINELNGDVGLAKIENVECKILSLLKNPLAVKLLREKCEQKENNILQLEDSLLEIQRENLTLQNQLFSQQKKTEDFVTAMGEFHSEIAPRKSGLPPLDLLKLKEHEDQETAKNPVSPSASPKKDDLATDNAPDPKAESSVTPPASPKGDGLATDNTPDPEAESNVTLSASPKKDDLATDNAPDPKTESSVTPPASPKKDDLATDNTPDPEAESNVTPPASPKKVDFATDNTPDPKTESSVTPPASPKKDDLATDNAPDPKTESSVTPPASPKKVDFATDNARDLKTESSVTPPGSPKTGTEVAHSSQGSISKKSTSPLDSPKQEQQFKSFAEVVKLPMQESSAETRQSSPSTSAEDEVEAKSPQEQQAKLLNSPQKRRKVKSSRKK